MHVNYFWRFSTDVSIFDKIADYSSRVYVCPGKEKKYGTIATNPW